MVEGEVDASLGMAQMRRLSEARDSLQMTKYHTIPPPCGAKAVAHGCWSKLLLRVFFPDKSNTVFEWLLGEKERTLRSNNAEASSRKAHFGETGVLAG